MSFRQTLPRLTQNSKSKSSKQWISRQLRDPYVKKRLVAANDDDPAASYSYYRSRSAFKLLEINDRMGGGGGGGGFLDCEDVRTVVDLGAAPGGWSQVVARKLGWSHAGDSLGGADALSREFEEQVPFHLSKGRSSRPDDEQVKKPFERHLVDDRIEHDLLGRPSSLHRDRGTIVAVDLLPIVPIPGVHIVRGDFLLGSTIERVRRLLASKGNASGKADVILSDMAANISGNAAHDTESSLEICESVFEFARANLGSADVIGRKKGGVLLVKFFAHPLLDRFRKESLEPNFHYVRYIKPDSSRAASREGYFLCQGWAPR